jgi:hypothetical protein
MNFIFNTLFLDILHRLSNAVHENGAQVQILVQQQQISALANLNGAHIGQTDCLSGGGGGGVSGIGQG